MEPEINKDIFSSSETAALVHYYRGEVHRMNTWRQRLDVTTNWAIITSAGFLSFGFGNKEITHFVFVLATIIVTCFLYIEARRYKYYDLWRWRIALINENYFARIFSPDKPPLIPDWRKKLADDLQHSQFKMTFWEAFGRRFRRNYSWLYIVLAICWFTKVLFHPEPADDFSELIERASVYHLIPGWIVITAGIVFNTALFTIAIVTLRKRTEAITIDPAERGKFKLPNI